jgi:DNA-binding SARP family transcriptional activator
MSRRTFLDGPPPDVSISLYAGGVFVHGSAIELTGRDFVVLAHLAWTTTPVAPETLEATIWPSLVGSARNNVQVHVYRLRNALGDRNAIQLTRAGYQLRDDISVDLRDVRSALDESFRDVTLATTLRERLESMFARMSVGRPARLLRQPAFGAIETVLRSSTVAVAKRLGIDAFEAGKYERALMYARHASADDSADEQAATLVVRSLVALDRTDEAAREYEKIDVRLRAAAIEPSSSFVELAPRHDEQPQTA